MPTRIEQLSSALRSERSHYASSILVTRFTANCLVRRLIRPKWLRAKCTIRVAQSVEPEAPQVVQPHPRVRPNALIDGSCFAATPHLRAVED
jgi:hypothetical protein